ncbi:MAG: hypothetical protein ACI30B_03650 [Paludibacteraceae bacterium]
MKTKNKHYLGCVHISNRLDCQRMAEGKSPMGGLYLYLGPNDELEKLTHGEVDDISELKYVIKCKPLTKKNNQ